MKLLKPIKEVTHLTLTVIQLEEKLYLDYRLEVNSDLKAIVEMT